MTNKEIKRNVNVFLKRNSITDINYNTLTDAVGNMGYTVIEFNSKINNDNVSTIVKNLNLDEQIQKSRGFTYASDSYRLIFINEDLTTNEKILVLSHEIGHIVCSHILTNIVIGNDVKEENEANEFAHYLLNQNLSRRYSVFINKNKKSFIVCSIIFILVIVFIFSGYLIKKQQSYFGQYYITTTGNKYHKKECIFVKNKNNVTRLTKEQFETGDYKACEICLPNK